MTPVGDDLYGVTPTHLVVSHDAAVTWQAIGPEIPPDSGVGGIAVQGSFYLLGTATGVLRSSAAATAFRLSPR